MNTNYMEQEYLKKSKPFLLWLAMQLHPPPQAANAALITSSVSYLIIFLLFLEQVDGLPILASRVWWGVGGG